jgi:ABC-type transport system involved in cytochrome c biogenesis permease subunit
MQKEKPNGVETIPNEGARTVSGLQALFNLPIISIVIGGIVMMVWKHEAGRHFIEDASLMMIALALYLIAAVLHLTDLYAPTKLAPKVAHWSTILGVFFNFSSWMVRWVAAYDREIEILRNNGNLESPWFFRYVPFANLYDLSLAFAFGAGITTVALASRKNFRVMGAFTLPLASLILVLARFIGSEFIDLPPILDSYWRPIHVGVASLSYGIALVCFAIAIIYLVKDRMRVEILAIWAAAFSFLVTATISGFSVLTEGVYRVGTFLPSPNGSKPFSGFFRVDLPWVGTVLAVGAVALVVTIGCYIVFLAIGSSTARRFGTYALRTSLLIQILSISLFVVGVNAVKADLKATLTRQLSDNPTMLVGVGQEIAAKQDLSAAEFAAITKEQFTEAGRQFFEANKDSLYVTLNTNPVELTGLISAVGALLFVVLFGIRTEALIEKLPSAESLDLMMYKTASLAFAGLAVLLITGAIWANESWGRPWGFDSKETGALVAWLTYAAFLHTRIAHGWTGRISAYFAIVGFLLVIFTYLGVSYLLPGLHSYA